MKIIIAIAVTFAASSLSARAFAAAPSVELSYAEMFDEICMQQTKYKIDPSWVSEVKARLPELQTTWTKDGSILLKTAEDIVGKKFTEKQFLVSLSVCSFPSLGDPLLVNMRYSLKSFTTTPLATDVTVGGIFHEILHRYIGGIAGPYVGNVAGKIPTNSKLLLKYQDEDATVKGHLHLLALQKAVYLKLGLSGTLKRIVETAQSLPNKSYARAWKIVNDLEDYSSFVRELQQ